MRMWCAPNCATSPDEKKRIYTPAVLKRQTRQWPELQLRGSDKIQIPCLVALKRLPEQAPAVCSGMVPLTGIEPVRIIRPRDFKSLVSTYSTTAALCKYYSKLTAGCQQKKPAIQPRYADTPRPRRGRRLIRPAPHGKAAGLPNDRVMVMISVLVKLV